MARIVIGTGTWQTIRGYLNSMFTELYAFLSENQVGAYTQIATLGGGSVTRVTTTLTTEPGSVMILDSLGEVITSALQVKILEAGGVYVLDIYSSDTIANVKIKITY